MNDKRDKATRDYHDEMQRLRAIEGGGQDGKRLTVTEVARTLLDRQHRTASGEIALTLNAKGETQINVQVPTTDELSIEAAAERAAAVYDALRARYPRGEV